MRMTKRALAGILACMLLGLTACGGSAPNAAAFMVSGPAAKITN